MIRLEKSLQEKVILNYFREKYADFPKGKVSKTESPDFLLEISPKKRIGIELTGMYKRSKTFVRRSLQNSLLNIIRKKEVKLKIYKKKKFELYWLIIISDCLSELFPYNFRNKLQNTPFSSLFDKVFVFDLFEGEVFDLQLIDDNY